MFNNITIGAAVGIVALVGALDIAIIAYIVTARAKQRRFITRIVFLVSFMLIYISTFIIVSYYISNLPPPMPTVPPPHF